MNTELLAQAATAELEDWGALDEATDHPTATHGIQLWEDGDASAGVWQCAPGPSRWKLETNEVIYLVAGRMTVTPDGGDAAEIGVGDMAVLPKGWNGTWDIHETVRKVYFIF